MTVSIESNIQDSEQRWGELSNSLRHALKSLIESFHFSVAAGDLLLINGGWYVTHSGLLRLARRKRCAGIDIRPETELCDPALGRWVFRATVYKAARCKGFVGYGDADPSNVSAAMHGSEMRVAETRAASRALRKTYGVGVCSAEELGSLPGPLPPAKEMKRPIPETEPVNGNGHHPLRDRLYLLIRQHKLDAAFVKAYAADYCDVGELRDATRDQIAGFIKHLAEYATADREGLLCQLNSYGPKPPSEALVQITPAITDDESEKAAGAA